MRGLCWCAHTIEHTGYFQHPRIVLGVALGVGHAAHTMDWTQRAGQHGIENAAPLPSLLRACGRLIQSTDLFTNDAHKEQYAQI
jgi:hypothetical protein